MPRDLFKSESPGAVLATRRWYAMPLAVLTHTCAIATLVVVPLLATGALPLPNSVIVFVPPSPAPTPPPPRVDRPETPPPAAADVKIDAAPREAPSSLSAEVERPRLLVVIRESGPPQVSGGRPTAALAAPPLPPKQEPTAPLRPGGDIKEPKRLEGPQPVYPAIARAARMEGMVILEATIGKDGLVKDVRVIRSAAVFDEAALAAVRQWRYTVPMLNGQPIEILMTVTVNFGLNR
jgi:periplasmic protein TonB